MHKDKLIEALNIQGATYIASANNFDVYRITTYDAAQHFISQAEYRDHAADNQVYAGQQFVQSEATFNANVRGDLKLYFFTLPNVNQVAAAIITSPNMSQNIEFLPTPPSEHIVYTINCNFQLEDGLNGPANTVKSAFPFYLIPGIAFNFDSRFNPAQVSEHNVLRRCWPSAFNNNVNNETQQATSSEQNSIAQAESDQNKAESDQNKSEQSDAEVTTNALWYTVEGNHIKINGMRKRLPAQLRGNLIIPSEIDGKPVVKIASYAFYNNDDLESVTLPDTLERVEQGAFFNCQNLQEIIIPRKLQTSCLFGKAWNLTQKTPRLDFSDSVASVATSDLKTLDDILTLREITTRIRNI